MEHNLTPSVFGVISILFSYCKTRWGELIRRKEKKFVRNSILITSYCRAAYNRFNTYHLGSPYSQHKNVCLLCKSIVLINTGKYNLVLSLSIGCYLFFYRDWLHCYTLHDCTLWIQYDRHFANEWGNTFLPWPMKESTTLTEVKQTLV